jgi:hypothetical protein
VIPIAGGVASFAEQGSPFNKVAGLGFGGVPSAAALDQIERAFAACGAAVQVELAHLGGVEGRHVGHAPQRSPVRARTQDPPTCGDLVAKTAA